MASGSTAKATNRGQEEVPMRDYHAEQMTGSPCQGKNCACAGTADSVYFGTRGAVVLTADDVRRESGVSCVPGRDTPSGGISVTAAARVAAKHGVELDYYGDSDTLRHWTTNDGYARLSTIYGCNAIGMYSNMPAPWRAHGSTFRGGHTAFGHDVRDDLPDSHYHKIQRTVCWHDPLRPRPIRIPWDVFVRYWQAATPLKGYAGFVKIPPPAGATYAKPMTDRTRLRYSTLGVHDKRTTGAGSTVRVIRGQGKLVEIALYAKGETYQGSNEWGALDLIGDEWVHLKRLTHVRGAT